MEKVENAMIVGGLGLVGYGLWGCYKETGSLSLSSLIECMGVGLFDAGEGLVEHAAEDIYNKGLKPAYEKALKPFGKTVYNKALKPAYKAVIKPVGHEIKKDFNAIEKPIGNVIKGQVKVIKAVGKTTGAGLNAVAKGSKAVANVISHPGKSVKKAFSKKSIKHAWKKVFHF